MLSPRGSSSWRGCCEDRGHDLDGFRINLADHTEAAWERTGSSSEKCCGTSSTEGGALRCRKLHRLMFGDCHGHRRFGSHQRRGETAAGTKAVTG